MENSSRPKFHKSIALIRNFDTGTMLRWLAVYDAKKCSLNFVTGERLEGESFRESVLREVAWTLDVERASDFLTSRMAQLNLEFIETLPHIPVETHFHVAFYNVEVYRQRVLDSIAERQDLHWVTSEEICSGRTKLGVPLDDTLVYLIRRSEVVQHWESADSQRQF